MDVCRKAFSVLVMWMVVFSLQDQPGVVNGMTIATSWFDHQLRLKQVKELN